MQYQNRNSPLPAARSAWRSPLSHIAPCKAFYRLFLLSFILSYSPADEKRLNSEFPWLLFFLIVQHTMAIAFKIRVGALLPEFLTNTLIFRNMFRTAGTISPGLFQPFPHSTNHFCIFIQSNPAHKNASFNTAASQSDDSKPDGPYSPCIDGQPCRRGKRAAWEPDEY